MNTSKKAVRVIAEVCRQRGITKVIFSPGSRSAPLVIAFSQIPEMECIVIPDERVAGYFALGMAQQLHNTVAVVCTSGTAVLNLSPAVCEAYYQKVPLLVLTADRKQFTEHDGGNQTIKQFEIFGSFAVGEAVNGDAETETELYKINEVTARLIRESRFPEPDVAHINIHLDEPLYETTTEKDFPEIIAANPLPRDTYHISLKDIKKIKSKFEQAERKMLIIGSKQYDSEFNDALKILNQRKDLVIVHESLSNLNEGNSIQNIDSCISLLNNGSSETYMPDLVITWGGQILSKKIKQFLKDGPEIHWDVPIRKEIVFGRNMFGMFDMIEPINEKQFMEILLSTSGSEGSSYKKDWLSLSKKAKQKSKKHLSKIPFCDLKVFDTLTKSFPANANIQYGNSTPVRYSNLFEHDKSLHINANRGTSGIDGCVSTAAGAAYANKRMTISIVGDVSFLYDSNALWNNYLTADFRIIVINNGGGNIFRLIDGPTTVKNFEKFFETKHNLTAKHLASMYDLPYYFCNSQEGLDKILQTFYKPHKGKPAILEIKTDGELSAEVYKKYFDYLRQTEK